MIYDVFMLSHGKPTTNICKKVMEVHPYGSNGDESLPSKWKQCVNPVEYKTRHTNCKMGFLYSIEVVRMHHFIKYGMPPNHRPQINGMDNGYL